MQSCWVRACVCPSMYLPAIFEHLPDFDHCWQKVRDLDNTKLMKVIRKMSTWSEIRKTYLQSQSSKSLPAHPWTPKDPTWVARPREIRLWQCCGLLKHRGIAAKDTTSCGLPQGTLLPQNPWAEGLNSCWSKQLPHCSYYSKERDKHHISHLSSLVTSTRQLNHWGFMPYNSHGPQGSPDLAGVNRGFSFRRKQLEEAYVSGREN